MSQMILMVDKLKHGKFVNLIVNVQAIIVGGELIAMVKNYLDNNMYSGKFCKYKSKV